MAERARREFDKAEDGTMITTHGGGTSRKRMHAAKDYSGSEIMRTIRDEVINLAFRWLSLLPLSSF